MAIYVGRKIEDYPAVSFIVTDRSDSVEPDDLRPDSIESLIWQVIKHPIHLALELVNYFEENPEHLRDTAIDAIKECFYSTRWITNPERYWNRFYQLLGIECIDLQLKLGDYYFDKENFHLSQKYYQLICNHYESEGLLDSLSTCDLSRYSKALCNLGLINCYSGNITKCVERIEKAYNIYPSHRILVMLLRCKIEFFDVDLSMIEEQYIYRLLTDHDDDILNFLVWFFERKGDQEESITSYMQIRSGLEQLYHMKYFVRYMIEKQQLTTITRFFEPLRSSFPIHYYINLLDCYLELKELDLARNIINAFEGENSFELWKTWWSNNKNVDVSFSEDFDFSAMTYDVYLLKKSKLQFLEKQIILSVESINQIQPENLTKADRIEYHLHMAALSKVSSYIVKEQEQYREILLFLNDRYRRILLNI